MPPVILMYHSVRDSKRDPFALCVSPRRFAQQMAELVRVARPVRLSEVMERNAPDRAVAVTFDDGYADNLHHALPILERHNVPATIFVATGSVGGEREFWWDELERLLLGRGRIAMDISLGSGNHRRSWNVGPAARRSRFAAWRGRHWKAWDLKKADVRQRLFNPIRDWLKQQTVAERESALRVLRQTVRGVEPDRGRHALTLPELKTLAAHRLIEIGAHTVNHPSLGWLDAASQWQEIDQSRRWLQDQLSLPVASFAYPHGSAQPEERDYTQETVQLVRKAGFTQAVTTRNASVSDHENLWELPRRHVQDWSGDEFAERLNRWLEDRP